MGYLILAGLVGVILGIIFTVVYYKRKLTFQDEILGGGLITEGGDYPCGRYYFIKRTYSDGNIKTRLEEHYI